MINYQYDPPISVSGRTFIVINRINLTATAQKCAMLFTGDKQPVAIICRGDDGEETIGLDGERIDAAALKAVMSGQGD